ncbi:hypothetical protein THOB06_20191 [Vibrio rotiferianus]|nr:hypothetical protein THOG10_20189 [Vibrio rotiferianus]CAH1573189.1 hypothetical protein THOB06_20191 [Vibrio rotiferianus]
MISQSVRKAVIANKKGVKVRIAGIKNGVAIAHSISVIVISFDV